VWDRIPQSDRDIFNFIANEIPRRTDADDVKYLRETRALHFRKYKKLVPKEAVAHAD
jgi:hypothetical protein